MSIYVGEQICIELEDGVKAYVYKDLPQGVDDDLITFDRAQGGDSDPTIRRIWPTKLIELSVLRIVDLEGHEEQLDPEKIRLMKADVVDHLFQEIMSRYYPLAYAELKALMETETPTQQDSGEPSTG